MSTHKGHIDGNLASETIRIETFKASSIGHREGYRPTPSLVMLATTEMPEPTWEKGVDALKTLRAAHMAEAEKIWAAMVATMPGGLLDALFAVMARETACGLMRTFDDKWDRGMGPHYVEIRRS